MGKGKRDNLERLLRSAWERSKHLGERRQMPSEGIPEGNKQTKEIKWASPFNWTICGVSLSGALAVMIFGGADARWVPILISIALLFAWPEIIRNVSARRTVSVLTMLGCIIAIWVLTEWPIKASPVLQPISVLADCERTVLPILIAPQTSLHLVSLNQKSMLSQDWGLFDVLNTSNEQQQWPSKQIMDAWNQKLKGAKLHPNRPPLSFWSTSGYKCGVSNHSQTNILDVALTMRIWFGNKGGEENAVKYTPILSPIDAGSTFTFYVFNDCPILTSAVLPNAVSVMVLGETKRRSVSLSLPHRNPVEPFMMFGASDIQWVREQPCQ